MSVTCCREMVSMKLNINTYLNKGWIPPHGLKSPATALEHVRPLWATGSWGTIEALRNCKSMLQTSATVATAEGIYKSDTQLRL